MLKFLITRIPERLITIKDAVIVSGFKKEKKRFFTLYQRGAGFTDLRESLIVPLRQMAKIKILL